MNGTQRRVLMVFGICAAALLAFVVGPAIRGDREPDRVLLGLMVPLLLLGVVVFVRAGEVAPRSPVDAATQAGSQSGPWEAGGRDRPGGDSRPWRIAATVWNVVIVCVLGTFIVHKLMSPETDSSVVVVPQVDPDESRDAPADEELAARGLPAFGEYVYVDELPEATRKVAPIYPDRARAYDISGTVMVQALIDREGRVVTTKVVESIPALDEASVEAVKQWRFKPATANGAPVAVWVAIPVRYSLHDRPPR